MQDCGYAPCSQYLTARWPSQAREGLWHCRASFLWPPSSAPEARSGNFLLPILGQYLNSRSYYFYIVPQNSLQELFGYIKLWNFQYMNYWLLWMLLKKRCSDMQDNCSAYATWYRILELMPAWTSPFCVSLKERKWIRHYIWLRPGLSWQRVMLKPFQIQPTPSLTIS